MNKTTMRTLSILAGVLLIAAGIFCLCNKQAAVVSAGVILGVFMMQLIISGMTFLGISGNITYIIKGAVILIACILDMRKYMTRK